MNFKEMLMGRKPAPAVNDNALPPLRIPPRPAAIDEAVAALAKATEARRAAEYAHIDASRTLGAQVPGEPPTISAAEVEAIGRAIEPARQAETEARAALDRLTVAYAQELDLAVSGPIQALRDAIAGHFRALDELLLKAATLKAESTKARVELPCRLPGAAQGVRNLLDPVAKTFERIR